VEAVYLQADGSSKKGILSSSGKIVVPVVHDSIVWISPEKGYITGRPVGNSWAFGLRNLKGDYLLEERFASLLPGSSLIIAKSVSSEVEKKELLQLFNFSGKELYSAGCDSANLLQNGDILLYKDCIGTVIRNDTSAVNRFIKLYQKATLFKYPSWEFKYNNINYTFYADSVAALNDSLIALLRSQRWGVYTLAGKQVLPFGFDSIYCHNQFLFLTLKSQTSVAELNGKELLPASSTIFLDSKFYFHWQTDDGKWKIANTKGKFISDSSFSNTGLLTNALLAAQVDSLWGYWHVSGKWQIPPKFKSASDFRFGYALVEFPANYPKKYALIDRNDSVYFWNQEAVMYYYGMISYRACADTLNPMEPKTEIVYPFPPYRYEDIRPWIPGYFTTHNGNLNGVLNSKGKELIYCHQDTLYLPSEKDSIFLYKRKNGSFGISDKYGNRTLYTNFQFKEVEAFHNGLARYKDNGLYGFIDQYGNVRISPQYPTIKEYSGNHVQVMFRGKWGYLDVQEKIKIQPYYVETLPVKNNLAIVRQGKKWEFLSTETGNKINVTSYDKFIPLASGKYLVFKGKKLGLTNGSGKEIIFPKYEVIYELTDSTFAVRRDGYYGVLDQEENILVNFQFGGIAYHPFLKQYIVKKENNPVYLSNEGQ
jgi:hypothetical protein